MKRSALIIAGGNINYKFNTLNSKFSSPALIPVNSKALAQYVLEVYYSFGYDSIYLVVDEEVVNTVKKELFETLNKTKTTVIGVENTMNAVQTLRNALDLPEIYENVTVNVVTTIPVLDIKENEILVENKLRLNDKWSGFLTDSNNIEIVRKNIDSQKNCYAFQGVFSIQKDILRKAVDIINSNDLIELIHKLLERNWNPSLIKTKWVDCGHEENYYAAKNELINSRNFNRLVVEKDQIIKKSVHVDKINSEIDYYLNLPEDLKGFFPSLLSKGIDNCEAYYAMTYFSYPNLSELSLYWNMGEKGFRTIYNNIDKIIEIFKTKKTSFSKADYFHFYLDKTITRLKSYSDALDNNLKEILFRQKEITINGKQYLSFERLKEQIIERLERMFINANFCVVHGDLCFNNILVNTADYSLILIDPRGSFDAKKNGISGDLAYDLAKLAHSSTFYYDYIVSDLFQLSISENASFNLTFNKRENDELLKMLTLEIIRKNEYDFRDIKMIVGLLFLSMTPLHNDAENRQLAMYLNGIQILNESING